jgi:hypothetical protein
LETFSSTMHPVGSVSRMQFPSSGSVKSLNCIEERFPDPVETVRFTSNSLFFPDSIVTFC